MNQCYIFEPLPENRCEILASSPFVSLRNLLAQVKCQYNGEAIDMSIGEPQGKMPNFVDKSLAVNNIGWSRYPKARGEESWHHAINTWLKNRYTLSNEFLTPKKHVLPLSGSREGLFLACLYAANKHHDALNRKYRPIIAFARPSYHAYYGSAIMSGCDILGVECQDEPQNWVNSILTMPEKYLNKLAALIVCNPDNPSGRILDAKQLTQLVKHAQKHDYILICDECYSEIYYKKPPTGVLEIAQQQGWNNIIVANSLSKRSGAPGLRSGFLAASENTITNLINMRHYSSAIPSIPIQNAAAQLWSDEIHVQKARKHYHKLRDIAEQTLTHAKNFTPPEAGFFLWLPTKNAQQACKLLWQKSALKTLPENFMANPKSNADSLHKHLRIAMVHDENTFLKAMQRIQPLLTTIQ